MDLSEIVSNRQRTLIGTLVVVLLAFLLVNYLVSRYGQKKAPEKPGPVFPKTKSFTPQELEVLQKGPYICPSISLFCQKGSDVTKQGSYIGFGFPLPTGSPIYASFDGLLTAVETSLPSEFQSEQFTTVSVENKDRAVRAVYYFKGEVPKSKNISAGEQIGKTGGGIAFYNDASLVFQLITGDPTTGTVKKLTADDFSP